MMTNMKTFNQKREERTEARIDGLLEILKEKPLYREIIIERMETKMGLGKTTASHIIQTAMRFGLVEYSRGFYSVAK